MIRYSILENEYQIGKEESGFEYKPIQDLNVENRVSRKKVKWWHPRVDK